MAKVKLSLQNLTPDQKVALINTIITAMTGNANFTTPNPTLASGTTAKNNLTTGINDYNTTAALLKTKLGTRDAAEAVADAWLTQLVGYAKNVSNGDKVKLESGGFTIRADAAPVGPMTQVLNLVVTAGDNDGTLDCGWDPTKGAGSYEVQVSVDPVTATSWAFKDVSNISTITLTGLTSGSKIWVRVRAIGAGNHKGPWSDPATKTVP